MIVANQRQFYTHLAQKPLADAQTAPVNPSAQMGLPSDTRHNVSSQGCPCNTEGHALELYACGIQIDVCAFEYDIHIYIYIVCVCVHFYLFI
jgi:hypothetical protein